MSEFKARLKVRVPPEKDGSKDGLINLDEFYNLVHPNGEELSSGGQEGNWKIP